MSIHTHIPFMYHPTNVFLLDDDKKFLNNMSLILDDTIPYVLNDDPSMILNYLESHTYQFKTLSSLITHQIFDGSPEPSTADFFSVNFARLQNILTSSHRFDISMVGLIDRLMIKMDGLEFCRQARKKKFPIKMLLLTGQTDTREAVTYFNENIIDGYLTKGEDRTVLIQKINDSIKTNTWKQFVELGKSLTGFLAHVLTPLADENFISLFEGIITQNKIIEFYLLDASCSFLLLNAVGTAKELVVRNTTDFKDCYDIAQDAHAPFEVLEALCQRQKFPYTPQPMGYAIFKPSEWEKNMISMQKIPHCELYYALSDRPDIQVFSFQRYLEEKYSAT